MIHSHISYALNLGGSGGCRGSRRDSSGLFLQGSLHLRCLVDGAGLAAADFGHARQEAVGAGGTFDDITERELGVHLKAETFCLLLYVACKRVKTVLAARQAAQNDEIRISDATYAELLINLVAAALSFDTQAVRVSSAQSKDLIGVAHLSAADECSIQDVGIHLGCGGFRYDGHCRWTVE